MIDLADLARSLQGRLMPGFMVMDEAGPRPITNIEMLAAAKHPHLAEVNRSLPDSNPEGDPMKISDLFPSKYLRATDIPVGQMVPVTMGDVQLEHIEDDGESKPVLYFAGKKKGLVLNKTNANIIAEHYGDDVESWFGKPLFIFAATTEFRGKTVPCLRVTVPRGQQPQQQPPPPAAAPEAPPQQPPQNVNQMFGPPTRHEPIANDDIPF